MSRVRCALARALVAEMGLVLCDEPLSNLDADLRERIRVEISALIRATGATTVYITHDQAEAFALADRVGVLERGRLVQLGRPEEIYTSPATAFVACFTGLAGELSVRVRGRAGSNGTVEVDADRHRLVRPLKARAKLPDPLPESALLAIRPTAVQLCYPDGDEHHCGEPSPTWPSATGDPSTPSTSRGPRASTTSSPPRRVARGEAVGLRFDPAGCLLFPLV